MIYIIIIYIIIIYIIIIIIILYTYTHTHTHTHMCLCMHMLHQQKILIHQGVLNFVTRFSKHYSNSSITDKCDPFFFR